MCDLWYGKGLVQENFNFTSRSERFKNRNQQVLTKSILWADLKLFTKRRFCLETHLTVDRRRCLEEDSEVENVMDFKIIKSARIVEVIATGITKFNLLL